MRKSVGQAPTAGEQTQQQPCRRFSDIGRELEDHTIGRAPMWNRKGLKASTNNHKIDFALTYV
jgi:hypothetical protein